MTITAGTYFLNALALDYPLIEWIETAQKFANEIILVDMGSSDGTQRAIRNKFGKTVRLVTEKWRFSKDYHEGIPRNKILQLAQCDWIYLTDCDEILHENDIAALLRLTIQDCDFYRLPKIDFYGSCYLRMIEGCGERTALIRNGRGIYFGPPAGRSDLSAHTPLVDLSPRKRQQLARKHRKNKKVDQIPLYHYGRCRFGVAIARSTNFFVKQDRARTGINRGQLLDEKHYQHKRPDKENKNFEKWTYGHPFVMAKWIKRHWRANGWEI